MSRLLRLALYGVLVVALAGPAMAATYYVSPAGNNANPGTAALPFQTIQHGLTQLAAPGDVLNIGAGTYIGSGTITIAVSGAAGNPIIVQASDAARPVLQNMAFLTTGSYLTFNSLIFDGSLVQESAFDLTRPGTNIVINGCDFMGITDNPLVNSINVSNSGDDVADDSPVRIWGASSVTINDCDFYAVNSPGDFYCIQVVNASGNTVDATGMDTSVLSDLTVTNCNNFGRNHFVGLRRPMENVRIENCAMDGLDAFLYARESNRVGSRIRQTLSGAGAAPGYPGTTIRNIVVRNCTMNCGRVVVIDDATASTSGKAGNITLENLTVNPTTQATSGSSIAIQFDHDSVTGLTPSNQGWMGDYENLTLRNITINDPAGGRDFNTGVFFGNGSNNAGYFANVVIQNCSWDVLDNAIRTHGFGGRNILIGGSAGTANNLKTRTTDGIQTNFHTTIAGSRIVDMTVSYNNFNVYRIGLYLYGGNNPTGIKAGFENFWLLNNTIFANTHSGLLIANGNGAHAVMRNMVVSGNVIDSSDNNGSGYPLWLWSTHTDAQNMSRDWVITGNTVRNNTTNGWGTIRTDGAGFGGKFDITNNTLQCGWFGIVLVGGAGAGLGHNNLTISGNTLYNGYIPPGFTAAQVNLPYGGVDFAATKIINATVVNNTMINLRPVRREEGDRDRNAPIAYEQGTSHSINNLLQNVVYNNNTAIGLWSNALQMDTGYVQNCTVENIIFPLATLHGRLARISNVSLNGLTVRNIDHKNSVFDQDAIWFLNTIGSGPVVLSNLILNCDDQPDHDWAGIWGTNDNAGTQDNVTIKNLVIKNPGGPGILLTNRKTNVRIEECLIINAGAKSQTGPAGNSGWGIQVEGPGNSNYTIVNNAIINASAGIKLEASFSVISGNVIGLRSDTNQSGIVVGGQGNTEVTVRRNGVAGPGVAPGGITDGTGLVILGGFGVISSSISNNTFAGFANGCVVQDGTGVKLWNNAFDKLSGTGLRVTAGSAGTVANFNAYSGAATTYSGIAAGANDVVSGNLRLASYDPTTMNFLLPMSSPPSPLINAGSGDGGSTPDGTTDIGYREGGSIGPTAPAGFSAPYCFLDAVAGNDANDGLTVPTAVQTWAVALTKVPGGGTIYVVSTTPGGVYPAGVVTITNVASQATPLVIRPATGATPVVKERFDLWGTSHVIFDGLTFDAAARHRFNILSGTGSSDLTVRNCIFDNALGGVVRTPGGTLDPPYPTLDVPAGRDLNMNIALFATPNTVIENCTFRRNNVLYGQGTGSHYSIGLEWWNQTLGLEGAFADPNVGVTDVLHGLRVLSCNFDPTGATVAGGYGVVARRGINDYIIDNCQITETANPLMYMRTADSATVPRAGGFGPWTNLQITNCQADSSAGYNTLARIELCQLKDVLIADCTGNARGNAGTDCPLYFTATGFENDSRITNCVIRDCSFSGNDYCMIVDEQLFTNFLMENCNFHSWGHPTGGGSVWYWTYSFQSGNQAYAAYNPYAWQNVTWRNCDFRVTARKERRVINMQEYSPNIRNSTFENLNIDGTNARESTNTIGAAWFKRRGALINVTFRNITLKSNVVLGNNTNSTADPATGWNTGRGIFMTQLGELVFAEQQLGSITFEDCNMEAYFGCLESGGANTTNTHGDFTLRNCTFQGNYYEGIWGSDGLRAGNVLIDDCTFISRRSRQGILWGGNWEKSLTVRNSRFLSLPDLGTANADAMLLYFRSAKGPILIENNFFYTRTYAGFALSNHSGYIPSTFYGPLVIQNNEFNSNGYGIYTGISAKNVTIRNTDLSKYGSPGALGDSQHQGDGGILVFNGTGASDQVYNRGALLIEDCTIWAKNWTSGNAHAIRVLRGPWTSITVQRCNLEAFERSCFTFREGYQLPIPNITIKDSVLNQPDAGVTGDWGAIEVSGNPNVAAGLYSRVTNLNVENSTVNADEYGVALFTNSYIGSLNITGSVINATGWGVYVTNGTMENINMNLSSIVAQDRGMFITNRVPLGGMIQNSVISASNGAGIRLVGGGVNGLTIKDSVLSTLGTDFADGADAVFVVEGNSTSPTAPVVVQNLTIDNNVMTGGTSAVAIQPANYGVTGASSALLAANNLQVSNVDITNNVMAFNGVFGVAIINATAGGGVDVSGNAIYNHGSGLVYAATPHDTSLFPNPGPAIAMSGGLNGVTITGNQIDGAGTGSGIVLGTLPAGPGAMLTNVTVTGNIIANTVGNTGIGAGAGAEILAATNCVHGYNDEGAGLQAAGDNSVMRSNTVINFATGASVTGDNNDVYSNIFADCTTGVYLAGGATGNLISYNGFVGNGVNGVGYTPSGANGDVQSASTVAQEIVSVDPYNPTFCLLQPGSNFVGKGSSNGLTLNATLDMGAIQTGYISGVENWRQF